LPENEDQLNKAAWKWLKKARQSPPPHYLYLLSLAAWGLENGVEGDWPAKDRAALKLQVDGLFGWKPENAMAWLLTHPDGPEKEEQADSLLLWLRGSSSTASAAAVVLSTIYSRQRAECDL
jgi:hypothetical protein